eukprot:2408152-Pyramimonas_sp.AAC.1
MRVDCTRAGPGLHAVKRATKPMVPLRRSVPCSSAKLLRTGGGGRGLSPSEAARGLGDACRPRGAERVLLLLLLVL